ncbi:MAG: glycoside hydrolase family 38 C-terminal domain-containing protein [Phycisphaerae bacterium]|jgi:alpha-mannosidase
MQKKNGIENILDKWRNIIKSKKRQIISFEEIIQQKIESLKYWIYPEKEPIEGWEYRQFKYTRKRERLFVGEEWKPIYVEDCWGEDDFSAIFRCKAKMPVKFRGKNVVLKLYFSGDSLLYINDKPYHGQDPFRDVIPLTNCATGQETYDFQLESYIMWEIVEPKKLECSHFAVFDQEINDAYWDLRAAFNVMITEGLEQEVVDLLRNALHKATRHIDQREQSYQRAREATLSAQEIIRKEVYETNVFRKKGLMHLCGNSHLDIVYLWTHAEFVRKIGRTHATALRMMERFAHYKFSQSQPLMYKEMKENYPDLHEQVKQRVKEGRWEVIGAFWVEPDCNLISGESFVRQILHGVDFIEREFNITPKTAWIPDVFGNAWTMPQILIKCGLKYFVTHKMAFWNDTNKWKHSVFWWQSPDGSKIFATVPPTHFIGTMEPDHLKQHWDEFSERATIGESLYAYGWGDGGGGPDSEMLEYAKRYENFPGMVPTKMSLVEECLERMYNKALDVNLPVLNDELYLEEHRGVYTTKGRLKKLNRYCEILYRKAEIFSCFAHLKYPVIELDKGWKEVLTNQFHDSLPGTHVTDAYLDLLDSYKIATNIGEHLLRNALDDIASRTDTRGHGKAVVIFNSQPYPRDSIVRIEYSEKNIYILDENGDEVPHQFIADFETGKTILIFLAKNISSVGYSIYRLVEGKGKKIKSPVKVSSTTLENNFLKVVLNEKGELLSLFDKLTNREHINPAKRGNVMKLYEDIPGKYDAWDIEAHYTDLEFDISGVSSIEIDEEGPVRSSIKITRNFCNSHMIQRIILAADSRRVDFETYVDWKEQHKLLKTRFHTNIITRKATYDIAFGNIDRPTTRNNSYEEAKFEVPAHMWMDLSQGDFGLSLLNDSKYGHEAHDGTMTLSLLKGPKYPDPVSDQEEHYFVYSLYSHPGDWRYGNTIKEAQDFNDPFDVILCDNHDGELPPKQSFLAIDNVGLTLEALKKAETSDEIVVRVVERHGSQHNANIRFWQQLCHVSECNLLEREDKSANFSKHDIPFILSPYEIKTFKIKFAF